MLHRSPPDRSIMDLKLWNFHADARRKCRACRQWVTTRKILFEYFVWCGHYIHVNNYYRKVNTVTFMESSKFKHISWEWGNQIKWWRSRNVALRRNPLVGCGSPRRASSTIPRHILWSRAVNMVVCVAMLTLPYVIDALQFHRKIYAPLWFNVSTYRCVYVYFMLKKNYFFNWDFKFFNIYILYLKKKNYISSFFIVLIFSELTIKLCCHNHISSFI